MPLDGCVNDATEMQKTLIRKYGFKKDDTTLLTDEQATRAGIIKAIKMYEKMPARAICSSCITRVTARFPDRYSDDSDETEVIFVPGVYPRGTYDSALVPFEHYKKNKWKTLGQSDPR